jgi:hypothetical protein
MAWLAHSLLKRRVRREGRRWAKRAAHLGHPWVLEALKTNTAYPLR